MLIRVRSKTLKNSNCKICSDPVRVIHNDDIKYFYCPSCRFIFKDKKFIPSPEKEKQRYMTHNNDISNKGYVEMLENFIKKTTPHVDSGKKHVLDYGCGNNPVLAALLQEKGYKVDTYDKYFAPEKTYRTKKYDIVTLTEVIEHIEDPLDTLNELRRIINKGGIIAIMTLFHPENTQEFKSWWYKRDFTHISFYSRKTLKYIAEILNMQVVAMDNKNTCVLKLWG